MPLISQKGSPNYSTISACSNIGCESSACDLSKEVLWLLKKCLHLSI